MASINQYTGEKAGEVVPQFLQLLYVIMLLIFFSNATLSFCNSLLQSVVLSRNIGTFEARLNHGWDNLGIYIFYHTYV
uniref:Uncharacterized protein n=1 Tax=Steinernema glaseri TaxID=37863 RepID=A0A1I7Y215_9BILA